MIEPIEALEDIKAVHYSLVHALHIVNHRQVCAPCARVAFSAGLVVKVGAFDEGEPVECESTFIGGMSVPYGVCVRKIHSTYGPGY